MAKGWHGEKERHSIASRGVNIKKSFQLSGIPDEVGYMEKVPRATKAEFVWKRKRIPVNLVSVKPKYKGSSVRMIDKSTGKEVSYITVMAQTLRKPSKKKETKTHTTKALAINDKNRTVLKPKGQTIEVYDKDTNELIAVYEYTVNPKTKNPEMVEKFGFERTTTFNINQKNLRDLSDKDVTRVVGHASVMIPIPVDEESNNRLYDLWKFLYDEDKVVYFPEVVLKKGTIAYNGVLIPDKTKAGTYRFLLKVGGSVEDTPAIRKL